MKSYYSKDFDVFEKRYRSTLFNSLSGFKSLNLIGTKSANGINNLGLFNSIFHLGANPFLIGFILRPDGPQHDTLHNIESTNKYTLNLVSKAIFSNAHMASARYPSGVSEFNPCGLTEWTSESGFEPYVKESPVRFGMNLREIIPVKLNDTKIVIGEVMELHLDEPGIITQDGFARLEMANIVTNLGLDAYYSATYLQRIAYAKPFSSPEPILNQTEL